MAETLGRPVYELEEELPMLELLEWRAFWKLKAAAEEKEIEKRARAAKSKSRRR